MTDTKTPKPGEWWLSGSSLIAYVVGFTIDGDPAWQQKGRRQVLSDEIGFFLACFHHEPRCDSFDWVEPEPEPEQAEWSDMAAIQHLDLRRSEMASSGRISSAENQAIIQVIDIAKRVIQPVETWPKYYVGKNWSDGDAYVRVDDTEAEFIWVSADGSERVFKGNRYASIPLCVSEHSWREVTEAEALARVTVHPDDIPLNPVPGKVVATGTLKLTPVESPDDWVEITDPKYVLRQGDQFTHCMSGDKWVDVVLTHGDWLGVGYKARCRRRDLPDLTCSIGASQRELKTRRIDTEGRDVTEEHGLHDESDRIVKRIPVDLIAMRDNRVIWRPHGQTLLKDEQFILHDADGFYVEGER